MPIGAAIGVGVVGAAGTAYAGSKNAKAINKSTDAQAQSNTQSLALQRDIYGQNKAALSPFMDRGNAAGERINALLGLGGDVQPAESAFGDFQKSTGFEFRRDEGMNALNSGYAGAGLVQSGAAMKDSVRYGQDYASGEFGNYLGYLGNQQGVGLSGASALAGVGQGYANNISAINRNNANALSASAIARANNTNGMVAGFGSSIGNSIGILQGAGKL